MRTQTVLCVDIIINDNLLDLVSQHISFFINIGLSNFFEIVEQELKVLPQIGKKQFNGYKLGAFTN